MDRARLALVYACYVLLRRSREIERNLRCQKCNPPRYKVNDDDSSTYSSEYECECSSNVSTESETESSKESTHENRLPAVSVPQPGPIQKKTIIPVAQPKLVTNQPTIPVGPPNSAKNLGWSNHSALPSRNPLQVAQQNVIRPHFQSQQPTMLNGRIPTQVRKRIIPPTPRQHQNHYFNVQSKLVPPALHDPFQRQMAEIEYWVRTHRAPWTYVSSLSPVGNTYVTPPPIIQPVPKPEIVKTQLTLVDDVSVSSNKSSKKGPRSLHKFEASAEENNINIHPTTIVDDKSSDDKSLKNEVLVRTHNTATEINKCEDSLHESNTIDNNINITSHLDISNLKHEKMFLPSTSTPMKRENDCEGNEGSSKRETINKKYAKDFEEVLNIVHKSPRRSTSTPVGNESKRVTRYATKRSGNTAIEKLFITPQRNDNLIAAKNLKQESPTVIAGPSYSSRIARHSREFFDDSDTSVLTAPYIRSTKKNTSKSRCQTLSRQRASQTKVKSISKLNNTTGHKSQDFQVSSKKLCSKDTAEENQSRNASDDMHCSTSSSRNIMTPNVSSNNSISALNVPRKRGRILQFTPFSAPISSTKRKSESVTHQAPSKKPRKLSSKSVNSPMVDGKDKSSNAVLGITGISSELCLSRTDEKKNSSKTLPMSDDEDDVPGFVNKFFA